MPWQGRSAKRTGRRSKRSSAREHRTVICSFIYKTSASYPAHMPPASNILIRASYSPLVWHSRPPLSSSNDFATTIICAHVWRVTCLRLWLLGADECCMLGEGGLFTIARVGCMVATQKGVQIQVNRGRSTPKMTRPARSCAHVPERSITKNARPILVEFFERLRSTEGFTLLHISRSTELCFGRIE